MVKLRNPLPLNSALIEKVLSCFVTAFPRVRILSFWYLERLFGPEANKVPGTGPFFILYNNVFI